MEPTSRRATIHIVSREFFQVSLVTYLLLTLAETLDTGFVSNFFNLNWLLLVVMVTGVTMVLTEAREHHGHAEFGEVAPMHMAPEAAVETAPPAAVRAHRPVHSIDGIRRSHP